MAEIVKLSRNGNSATLVISRVKLAHLGWRVGEIIATTVVDKRLIAVSMQSEVDRLDRENGDTAAALNAKGRGL